MEEFLDFAQRQWPLFLALATIIALFIGGEVSRRLRGVDSVNVNRALDLYNHQEGVWLDVRDNNEFANGHIKDARHVPLSALKQRTGDLEKYKGRPLLVYCRTGNRSGMACGILKKAGFEPVYNVSGGVVAWQNANLPLVKGKK